MRFREFFLSIRVNYFIDPDFMWKHKTTIEKSFKIGGIRLPMAT